MYLLYLFRISVSADENIKTNSGFKYISENWKIYAFFVFQSHCFEKEPSKSLRKKFTLVALIPILKSWITL